jgi:hypothetical protein
MTETLPNWLQAIKPAGQESQDPKSFMIYGPPGTRKTSMAKSIADVKNEDGSYRFPRILFIDIDDGTEVIEGRYRDRIQILSIKTADQIRSISADLQRTDLPFDVVVWDSIDVAQDVIELESKGKFSNGWEMWDAINSWTTGLLRTMHSNPTYIGIAIAHSESKKEKTGGVREVPKLTGKSNREVGGIPSTVIYTSFDDDGNHISILGGDNKLEAKNRYRLPNRIADLDFPRLYRGIDMMIEQGMEETPNQNTNEKEKDA